MFSRLALPAVILIGLQLLAGQASGFDSNARRLQRGLNPIRPKRLYDASSGAARTFPSGTPGGGDSCFANLEGYLTVRHHDGSLLGWLDTSGEKCTSSSNDACKFSFPAGFDVATYIQRKGYDLYLGVYGRSIVDSILSSVKSLSRGKGSFSFTGCKLFSGLFGSANTGGAVSTSGDFVNSYPFIVDASSHAVSAQWVQDGSTISLSPFACMSGADVSLQWVHGSVNADAMASVCPSGIEADISVGFECSCDN